jgi:hypothetical protein
MHLLLEREAQEGRRAAGDQAEDSAQVKAALGERVHRLHVDRLRGVHACMVAMRARWRRFGSAAIALVCG